MTPHLVRWHNELKDDGLVIIEVDNGGIDSLADLKSHVADEQIPFAVLHDSDGSVCEAYGVRAYPTAFLMDRSGKVIWEGHPTPHVAEAEIRKALADAE
ncbi:MAG: peroxiredoxin family protein [Pirellulaceae bacterium]